MARLHNRRERARLGRRFVNFETRGTPPILFEVADKPTVDVYFESTPTRADVRICPESYPQGTRTTVTDNTIPRVFRGYWSLKCSKNDIHASDRLDLVNGPTGVMCELLDPPDAKCWQRELNKKGR